MQAWLKPRGLPPVALFLQQGHSYFSKVPPANGSTLFEPIGAIFIQIAHSFCEAERVRFLAASYSLAAAAM